MKTDFQAASPSKAEINRTHITRRRCILHIALQGAVATCCFFTAFGLHEDMLHRIFFVGVGACTLSETLQWILRLRRVQRGESLNLNGSVRAASPEFQKFKRTFWLAFSATMAWLIGITIALSFLHLARHLNSSIVVANAFVMMAALHAFLFVRFKRMQQLQRKAIRLNAEIPQEAMITVDSPTSSQIGTWWTQSALRDVTNSAAEKDIQCNGSDRA